MRSVSLRSSLASVAGFNRLALGNTRTLAGAATQVIQLRTTHHALADDGDRIDVRRIEREYALNAFTERNLAHGEVRTDALVGTGDHDAFIVLNAGALTFDHLHTDANGIAGAEFGNALFGLRRRPCDFFGFDLLNQVHRPWSSFLRCAPEAG